MKREVYVYYGKDSKNNWQCHINKSCNKLLSFAKHVVDTLNDTFVLPCFSIKNVHPPLILYLSYKLGSHHKENNLVGSEVHFQWNSSDIAYKFYILMG